MLTLIVRPTPTTSRLVRTKEAALYIGISEKKLRMLVRLHKIPVIQDGNVWKFDVRALDAYIDSIAPTAYPTPSGTGAFQ